MVKVSALSIGKKKLMNEDNFGFKENCFVVADGSTDKSHRRYNNKTGGGLASRTVVDECLSTNINGVRLVSHINKKIRELYYKYKIRDYIKDPMFRFSAGFVCVRIIRSTIKITSVGDVKIPINIKSIRQPNQMMIRLS